ncbi:hypothetical protein GXM_02112 [Nostoc sphaeroides CCNUC1]|uniref:Uncharacterized protein n=2 Tax=Nostoc sphaeroides TaxID=446679 RepID=A0A5P8VWA8_9NOSO|nr:hypothetical protein GXM_02112 [Nostoc sphaeroides CCNUC1]
MRESVIYQEILAEGEQRGEQRGLLDEFFHLSQCLMALVPQGGSQKEPVRWAALPTAKQLAFKSHPSLRDATRTAALRVKKSRIQKNYIPSFLRHLKQYVYLRHAVVGEKIVSEEPKRVELVRLPH